MARPKRRTALLPQRHDEPDLFLCDILDATPKGDRASMEHPLFSLSVKKDMAPFEYTRGQAGLRIVPAAEEGRANIFDRDILIYVLSQLMAAKEDRRPIGRRVRICAHDLLKATNRHTSGQAYATLRRALTRLQYTQIHTNIHDHGISAWRQISLITDATIVKEDATGRMLDVELELGDWLVKAVENNNVLTLSREYFQLRKPLERRLYELARKHCGQQSEWRIGLSILKDKCGSNSSDKEFKRLVKNICDTDAREHHMPDYTFELAAGNLVVRPRPELTLALGGERRPALSFSDLPVSPDALEKGRALARGWDIHALQQEWRCWVSEKGISVNNMDAHFLDFCRKRGPFDTAHF
ncbi:replication initiator protein A (plasmid) [Acuticoccus sp. MNP-M23]|uniref:replication initiator protein A n=1 Tax=Acuticoccus sp. MNP-M23 TaxID=3072793 RepID=UPI0028161443|nr:replication initiator protein A [Acuticoccus sp. MNP-M23]WMS45303.1 replication initiator protein A [Acuticoccus sp. MNP-M23]